jgi:hypothetical protein
VQNTTAVEFGPPVAPDWLTERGAQIWADLIKDAARYGITDLESTLLGNLCNLQGAVADCFKCGAAPPAVVLAEIRRMMQALRIPPRRASSRDER